MTLEYNANIGPGCRTSTECNTIELYSRPPIKALIAEPNNKTPATISQPILSSPHRLNNRLTKPPAIFLANPPEYIALDARFSA